MKRFALLLLGIIAAIVTPYVIEYFNQPPHDDNAVIFAQDKGAENVKLMEYYPQRHVYMVNDLEIEKIR